MKVLLEAYRPMVTETDAAFLYEMVMSSFCFFFRSLFAGVVVMLLVVGRVNAPIDQ